MSRKVIIHNTTFIVNSYSREDATETLDELLKRVIVKKRGIGVQEKTAKFKRKSSGFDLLSGKYRANKKVNQVRISVDKSEYVEGCKKKQRKHVKVIFKLLMSIRR